MQVMTQTDAPTEPTVITIGNFDGVHLGHQALIQQALAVARQRAQKMLVVTFEPHPVSVLRGPLEHFLITPGPLKLHFLDQIGAQWVRIIAFTRKFSQMSAEAFLDGVLGDQLRASAVVVGYNFSFGQGGLGNAALLEDWGRRRQVTIEVLPPYRGIDGMAVSSSAIRELVRQGHLVQARALLGHAFAVQGTVVAGEHRGRHLQAPTLNLPWPLDQVAPPFGVYAGLAQLGEGAPFPAVCNFGVRPTFGGGDPRLEVHLLDVQAGEHYGESLRLELHHFLREERKFTTPVELAAQIQRDIDQARRLLEDSKADA
jgi:riboflavin kinase/FMN adenylyltransferase